MSELTTSLRLMVVSLLVCSVVYPAAIRVFARRAAPEAAEGSLLRNSSGQVIGSRLIAQSFTQPRYLWPRPSAVDYNAAEAGGSNLSPANPELTALAAERLAKFELSEGTPLPAELVSASGSGLDPHVTLAGALVQAPRIAAARGLPVSEVENVLRAQAWAIPGGEGGLVNVLQANLALDAGP